MERIAFKMKLFPGQAAEYRRRHDALWPELAVLLREAGIRDYRIFLDAETNILFATLTRPADHRMDDLPRHPVMRRWWDHMKDIMRANPDGSPVAIALEEMFFLA